MQVAVDLSLGSWTSAPSPRALIPPSQNFTDFLGYPSQRLPKMDAASSLLEDILHLCIYPTLSSFTAGTSMIFFPSVADGVQPPSAIPADLPMWHEENDLRGVGLLEDLKYPTPILKVPSLNRVVGSFRTLLPYLPFLTHYELATNIGLGDLNVPCSSLRSFEFSKYSKNISGVFLHIPECTRLEGLYITNFAS